MSVNKDYSEMTNNILNVKSPSQNLSNLSNHPNEISKDDLLFPQSHSSINYKQMQNNSFGQSNPNNLICLNAKTVKRRRGIQINSAKLKQEEVTLGLRSNTSKMPKDTSKPKLFALVKSSIDRILDSPITLLIFLFAALFSLIGIDLRTMCVPIESDPIFNAFYLVTMVLLGFEMVITFIGRNDYRFSFLFWLDILAMISMALEVFESIADIIAAGLSITIGDVPNKELIKANRELNIYMIIQQILQIVRLTLLVRMYRAMLAIMRHFELKYRIEEMKKRLALKEKRDRRRLKEKKNTNYFLPLSRKTKRKKSIDKRISMSSNLFIPSAKRNSINNVLMMPNSGSNEGIHSINIQSSSMEDNEMALIKFTNNQKLQEKKQLEIESESQISKIVAKSITQKIIVMILMLLLVLPILDEDNYLNKSPKDFGVLCELINKEIVTYEDIRPEFNASIQHIIGNNSYWTQMMIQINTSTASLYRNETLIESLPSFRFNELGYQFSEEGEALVMYSMKEYFKVNAVTNLLKTCFVCGVLLMMAYTILKDTKKNILDPLEVMIGTVNAVARDPVNYQSLEKLNKGMADFIKSKQSRTKKKQKEVDLYVDYEIQTIQFAIIRISSLMAIGFGEAGGQILKENINSFNSLNPMLPGKKINGVFGFCLIRHFQQINEALQEKTIVFVNSIADIVHSNVTKFGGACNKNIGESFLLVWKFPLDANDKAGMALVANSAVLSFLNIIKKIHKSNSILAFNNDPLLQAEFKGKFKVQMGFGLHLGWGIEGAIGSFYKIDCSYLSPNVNIAARLETATNIYGVDMLISGEMHSLLSFSMQKRCREIDRVTLKGSVKPVSLFTIDCNKKIGRGRVEKKARSAKEKRLYINSKKVQLFSSYEMTNQEQVISIDELYLKKSKGLRSLLEKPKSALFLEKFQKGFIEYIGGNWLDAYQYLKEALFIDNRDGPTNCLIKFIERNNKFSPVDWKGYRVLSAKF